MKYYLTKGFYFYVLLYIYRNKFKTYDMKDSEKIKLLEKALRGCMEELEKYTGQHISSGKNSADYLIGEITLKKVKNA